MPSIVHFNLDEAWERTADFRSIDLRDWGPRLRYCAPSSEVEAFYRRIEPELADFILYGSGDFHYLAALWLRRLKNPTTVISFDNHPDWDVRPPRWACGGWVNRALELPLVQSVQVWGCGNFELNWPARLFANHRALASRRLQVFPWDERISSGARAKFSSLSREKWRERFAEALQPLTTKDIYVTVDLDCIRQEEAVTNWEQGLFSLDDITWALREIHKSGRIVGGDFCGGYSPPRYARKTQRFVGNWDHPQRPAPSAAEVEKINRQAFAAIWPALCGG